MASELIVQTIQGPSSGANANKVLIPSGHTLDVSGGTLVPSAGQVVQVVNRTDVSATGTSSTSFVNSGVNVTITPKFANSKIFIQFIGTSYSTGSGKYTIYRDATNLELISHAQVGSGSINYSPSTLAVFDEPNTTSLVTYSVYYAANSGSVYWPPGSADVTQCIAMEIAQ